MTELPKYFIIKKDLVNPSLFYDFIKWLNIEFDATWSGGGFKYYGYDNNTSYKSGTNCHDEISEFINSPVLITLEDWSNVVYNKPLKKTLPKFFVVERQENELWTKFINWLNITYEQEWNGTAFNYYGYDGNNLANNNGTDGWDSIKVFKNNVQLLTLEEWDAIVNTAPIITKLPEYFIVKQDDSKLCKDYIEWLNKTYKTDWTGSAFKYYGYDGNTRNSTNGTEGDNHLCSFKNSPTLITLEEWARLVKCTPTDKKYIITSLQAQSIIDIACNGWKAKLADKWAKDIVLNKTIEVLDNFYKEMRKACTKPQHILFDKIFGKDEKYVSQGTPCLVSEDPKLGWELRYADGHGKFYDNGNKSGSSSMWTHYTLLDIDNLPVSSNY